MYLLIGFFIGIVIAILVLNLMVAKKYVSKNLFDLVKSNLNSESLNYNNEKAENESNRKKILQLTGESENKLSKSEVEQKFVPRSSFDILTKKLSEAEEQNRNKSNSIITLNKEVTQYKEKEEGLTEKLKNFKEELNDLHLISERNFKNVASELLDDKKKIFVDENKRELNTLLAPFKNDLNQFKEKVEATRSDDIRDLTSLKKELESLAGLNQQLSEDAKNLTSAMKSEVKMQGSWGEERLNMILETEGLQKYIDYSREEMYNDNEADKNRRPDFILKLPNEKHIIIDSKVSLTAYVEYFNASDLEEKQLHLKSHLKSITDHIDRLADKNYQALAGLNSPDYVFMFMPVEPALTLALNQSPEIFERALKRKIVLITPTSLVATLKIVRILWQKENQVKNVQEIFRQCGELYNKFVAFLEEMDKVENALNVASRAHRDAMYCLTEGTKKGNTIIGRFESIKKLEARTNKKIPEKYLAEIDMLPESHDAVVLDSELKDEEDIKIVSGNDPTAD